MISKLIKNCKVFVDGKLEDKNLILEDHKIRDIVDYVTAVDEVIDAKGLTVLPGIIDCHVHFREPGFTQKEDFFTGSCAAAAGGVTTILDMPNTNPPTISAEFLKEKRKLAEKSIVNYGFHFGATSGNYNEFKKVKDIASVKAYMDLTTGNLKIEGDEALSRIFDNAKRISVHAEGPNVEKAVGMILERKKHHLHLCHISTEDEIKFLKKNKRKNVSVEVTPHHLFLTSDDDKDAFTKMKPSLKSAKDQEALWNGISKGVVDTIGSDHAPHTIEEKNSPEMPYGVPGVETLLPLLLDAVNNEKLELKDLVRLTAENPAKIFKIANKGSIKEGYDADLVFVDMNLTKEVKNSELFTKCKWSPFNGKILKGWPVMTMVRGNIIFNDTKINDTKGKEVGYIKENPFVKKAGTEIKNEENTASEENKDEDLLETPQQDEEVIEDE